MSLLRLQPNYGTGVNYGLRCFSRIPVDLVLPECLQPRPPNSVVALAQVGVVRTGKGACLLTVASPAKHAAAESHQQRSWLQAESLALLKPNISSWCLVELVEEKTRRSFRDPN